MTVVAILACLSLIWLICKVTGVITTKPGNESLVRWITIAAAVIFGLWVFHAELHIWIGQAR